MKSKLNLKSYLAILCLLFCLSTLIQTQHQEDFDISDKNDQNFDQDLYNQDGQQEYQNSENAQRQMQYMSQRRSACLVLSRYYLNQFSDSISGIIKDLTPEDQNKFINKMYATAVEKCEPLITEMQVMQFFTSNENFDPSEMFHIFDGYNFYQITLDLQELSPNQQTIIKFIKQFDAEMEVRKQEQQAQKNAEQADEGIQVFFISLKNLPPQIKYLYIVLVLLISGAILWYGFNQLEKKPQKKSNKRRKKQE